VPVRETLWSVMTPVHNGFEIAYVAVSEGRAEWLKSEAMICAAAVPVAFQKQQKSVFAKKPLAETRLTLFYFAMISSISSL
jgi:hypothetical protein